MTEQEQASSKLADLFKLGTDRQFADVIVQATLLEKILMVLLEAKMENFSNNLKADLAEGKNAPLSSFSAKIDLAYALGSISQDQRGYLHHVRKIRNVFAHTDQVIHFDHPAFQNDKTLKGNPLAKSDTAFYAHTAKFMDEITPAVENAYLIMAIKQHGRERRKS